jgi:hypothetical protein
MVVPTSQMNGGSLNGSLSRIARLGLDCGKKIEVERQELSKGSKRYIQYDRWGDLRLRAFSLSMLCALCFSGCTWPLCCANCPFLDPAQYGCGPRVPCWNSPCCSFGCRPYWGCQPCCYAEGCRPLPVPPIPLPLGNMGAPPTPGGPACTGAATTTVSVAPLQSAGASMALP